MVEGQSNFARQASSGALIAQSPSPAIKKLKAKQQADRITALEGCVVVLQTSINEQQKQIDQLIQKIQEMGQ